jgi:hypothetical protein
VDRKDIENNATILDSLLNEVFVKLSEKLISEGALLQLVLKDKKDF